MIRALACEVERQVNLLETGDVVPQETRGFDESRVMTFKLRSKEDAPEYRYMPDPNLPPLIVTKVVSLDLALPAYISVHHLPCRPSWIVFYNQCQSSPKRLKPD